MTQRRVLYEQSLRDPGLSALLRETYADDPALVEAPGRTERIMRMVLSSGVRPVRRRRNWMPVAWTAGTAAATAALMVIVLWLGRPHRQPGGEIAMAPSGGGGATPAALQRDAGTRELAPMKSGMTVPAPEEVAPRSWFAVGARQGPDQRMPVAPAVEESPDTTQSRMVAAALYSAGSAAHEVGEYELAYAAYRASYDTVPTPEALLASARALELLGEKELASES